MFHWQKILFSGAVTVSYLATGIACALYASQWGEKPVVCALADQAENEDDICDSIPLTATNALEAVSIPMLSWSVLYVLSILISGILFHSSGSIWTHNWCDNLHPLEEQETDSLTSLFSLDSNVM